VKDPGFRELKKTLEHAWTFAGRPFEIDVARCKGDEDLATKACAGKENIQAPLAAFRRDRPKRHAVERLTGLEQITDEIALRCRKGDNAERQIGGGPGGRRQLRQRLPLRPGWFACRPGHRLPEHAGE
jgi:hypothetical protein